MSGQELEYIQEAFESNYIAPLGPQVDAFEKEFCEKTGITNAVALSSGTAAMHLALRNLGVGPGDEVIASTLTFIGSISPIVFQGGVPVFIDSEFESWNMDTNLLAQELQACSQRGRLPKAVVPTDLYGQCADLNRILEICAPYGVPVVVDAAEALGAQYKRTMGLGQAESNSEGLYIHAGKGAQASVFSFNGNKIITTSGGGMLASDDKRLIEHARFLSQQARDPAPHYEHTQIGYNYRMSNIVAAIGRGQLQALDDRVEKKRQIFEYYKQALSPLPGIELMPEAAYGRSTRWLSVILIKPDKFGADREVVRLALDSENIESRPLWKPMHLQPVFDVEGTGETEINNIDGKREQQLSSQGNPEHAQHKARAVGGAVSETLFERGLCLPSGTQMSDEDLGRVVDIIVKLHAGR